ncbi:MAG: hypothetical protein HRU19_23150 [Pseudobacteriovorax sp.]|nr:hypothetical protein [Pseudobacteriovorax sp.]
MKLILLILGLSFFASVFSTKLQAANRHDRHLVVVSYLDTENDHKLHWLYSFLDVWKVSLAYEKLGLHYRGISVLADSNATIPKFTQLISNLTSNDQVKAVDTILSVHGWGNKKLQFFEGRKHVKYVARGLSDAENLWKLRLMYNLACYGSVHRQTFTRIGYKTAVGSRKTNTTSATEYPMFLNMWKTGAKVGTIFDIHNTSQAYQISDAIAENAAGFSDADSFKLIRGSKNIRISSDAI